ncbi:MAG: FAD:protein FMN transferase [Bacteroidales bacterium]|nr:FAD:protein FMN transferase [Bacteroidales bacterium]
MKPRLLTAIIALALAAGCTRGYETAGGYAQGGTYSVKYNAAGVQAGRKEIAETISAILDSIDVTFSGYNKMSILSRRNAGEDVPRNGMFLELERISEEYREMSGGAFDIAAAPLFDVWGFGFKSGEMPTEEQVAGAMALCRERKILNFNAIAQGYTCDRVAAYLHSIGVHDMLVDIGEIYCEGLNPDGKPWSIGVDTPSDDNVVPGSSLSAIWTSDGGAHGVVTSGNYRKFYIRDGHKYAHTIDPRTGRPVEHDLLSATVVSSTATDADALATFFMVVGFDEARAFVESHPGIEACLITSDEIWRSGGF